MVVVGAVQNLGKRVVGRILVEKQADILAGVEDMPPVADKFLVVVVGRNLVAEGRIVGLVGMLAVALDILVGAVEHIVGRGSSLVLHYVQTGW